MSFTGVILEGSSLSVSGWPCSFFPPSICKLSMGTVKHLRKVVLRWPRLGSLKAPFIAPTPSLSRGQADTWLLIAGPWGPRASCRSCRQTHGLGRYWLRSFLGLFPLDIGWTGGGASSILDPEYCILQPGLPLFLVAFISYKTLFHFHKHLPNVCVKGLETGRSEAVAKYFEQYRSSFVL